MGSVIDASVALKIVLIEDGRAEATVLLRQEGHTAPDVFRLEIANGLGKRVRKGSMSPEEARIGYTVILSAVPDIVSAQPYMAEALELAMALNHPVADCVYLALARSLGCPLVTADQAFLKVARQGGFAEVVPL